jgi:hypothetical protein
MKTEPEKPVRYGITPSAFPELSLLGVGAIALIASLLFRLIQWLARLLDF